MQKFGLIGYPLSHSFSKGYFAQKFIREGINDCNYENYPIEAISKLEELIDSENKLVGLNVTIPYKEQVIPYLDDIDSEASLIGAINTIKITRSMNGVILKGFNTDATGFEQPLLKVLNKKISSALILGTGGASKAVAYILKKHNIKFYFVSRKPRDSSILSYTNLSDNIIRENKLIINTSPVGMYPKIDECPDIPYNMVGPEHILYDLIYNPEETLFLKKGKEKKATLINGLPMLIGQAERSWKIWNDQQ